MNDQNDKPRKPQRTQVFISYSHQDKNWLKELQITLTPYVRASEFEVWDDTRIEKGAIWKDEIKKALDTAKVAVLLVSRYFFHSEFIANDELPPLLDASQKDGLTILWVAVSASPYKKSKIANYQAVNDPAKPLDALSKARRSRELVAIAEEIERAMRGIGATIADRIEGNVPKPVDLSGPDGGPIVIDDLAAGRRRVAEARRKRPLPETTEAGETRHSLAQAPSPAELDEYAKKHQERGTDALRRAGATPVAGPVRENPRDGLKYVWIPPGTFMMGCSPGDPECDDDEKPAHQVSIRKGFWLGQTPVTVAAYKHFASSGQMPPPPDFNPAWKDQQMPIVNVTWHDADAYCTWARGRLPTEAEWEYAARAGSTEARYGPLDEIAWYLNNSGGRTREVGQKRSNSFGLHDMLGNVWEWLDDRYDEKYYKNSPGGDPPGPSSDQFRVLRGGSWSSRPPVVRVSNRLRGNPGVRDYNLGFRCVGEL